MRGQHKLSKPQRQQPHHHQKCDTEPVSFTPHVGHEQTTLLQYRPQLLHHNETPTPNFLISNNSHTPLAKRFNYTLWMPICSRDSIGVPDLIATCDPNPYFFTSIGIQHSHTLCAQTKKAFIASSVYSQLVLVNLVLYLNAHTGSIDMASPIVAAILAHDKVMVTMYV